MASSSANDDSLPNDFDLNLFIKYSHHENMERRKSAARNVSTALVLLDHNASTDRVEEFLLSVEELIVDTQVVQLLVMQAMGELFACLTSKNRGLYKQANMRLPPYIVRTLLNSPSNPVVYMTICAIQKLLEEKLPSLDVVVNLLIPALFKFITKSNEDLNVTGARVNDQEWWTNIVDILLIFGDVIKHHDNYPREWIYEHFLPDFITILSESSHIHRRKQVREVLAGTIARIAEMIGTEEADFELVPVFRQFMQDVSVDVHYALVKSLSKFFHVISPQFRSQISQDFKNLMTIDNNAKSWRMRAEFAEQLTKILHLFPIEQIDTFSPFALTFSADRIAVVRNAGILLLAEILASFVKMEWFENENREPSQLSFTCNLLNDIRSGFLHTRCWRRRQSFGRFLRALVQKNLITEKMFFSLFTNDLIIISNDEIPNIRQYFCFVLQSACTNIESLEPTLLISRLEEMASLEKDLEIRYQAMVSLGHINPTDYEIDLRVRKERLECKKEIQEHLVPSN